MRTIAILLTAAFAIAAQAFADKPAAPTPAGAAAPQANTAAENAYLDKVICKKQPPPTGTLLGTRSICHTERDWREITRRSRDDVEKRQTFHAGRPGE